MAYAVSKEYRASRTNEIQSVTPYVSIGIGIDTTALDDVTDWGVQDGLPMSNTDQIANANYLMGDNLATYEADGIPTSVDAGMVAPPLAPMPSPPEVGVWSAGISDWNHDIQWQMDIRLSRAHTSAFTVYSGGVTKIVYAEAVFFLNGAETRRVYLSSAGQDYVQDSTITTYDRIVFKVTKIDRPYSHVRIAEVEFGASITISNSNLADTISLVSECDPLGLTIPLSQLDYSIINVDGEYDVDNPSRHIDLYKIGTPVYYSLTVEQLDPATSVESRVTVPMGRYYITSRNADPERLGITAQDVRSVLHNTVRPLTLSTGTSVGATLQALFEGMDIPHVIEESLYSVMPDRDITLPDDADLLQQLLWIQQYFDVFSLPERDGYIHAVKGMPDSRAEPITAETLLEYPKPSIARGYNYITINYGDKHYDIDLRPTPDSALMPLSINNPIIDTEARAKVVADRIRSRFFSQVYEAEALGDPSLDVWDVTPIEGRWTRGSPLDYRVVGLELEYDGGLTMYVKGVR